MENTAIIIFTHSNYKDVWPMFFGQAEKYLKGVNKYLFIDAGAPTTDIPDDYTTILYNEADTYQIRFASCLVQVPEDIVILHHEDMPLYDAPNLTKLQQYINMVRGTNVTSIKLLKGGELNGELVSPNLYEIPSTSEWLFSIQPTIWKKKDLLEIYYKTLGATIWEFEVNAQDMARFYKQKNLYHYDGEPKRGMYHFDSNVYPYIATAVSKGKWVTSEYPKELGQLFKEYNIDPSIRGGI